MDRDRKPFVNPTERRLPKSRLQLQRGGAEGPQVSRTGGADTSDELRRRLLVGVCLRKRAELKPRPASQSPGRRLLPGVAAAARGLWEGGGARTKRECRDTILHKSYKALLRFRRTRLEKAASPAGEGGEKRQKGWSSAGGRVLML